MYKIAICCLNSKYIHSSLAPWCLYSALTNLYPDISAVVSEGTINEKEDDVLSRILSENANAISFSCYIWNITQTLSLARKIKERKPNTTIILGGPEVSFNSCDILKENSFVDFVLCGEGEESFPLLIHALSKGETPEPFLASMRTQGEISQGKQHIAQKTFSPYCKEYLNNLSNKIAYIESCRGCPYNCAFCLSGDDRTVRFFDLEKTKEDMLLLAKHGAKTVKFVDRTFNCNAKRANEILLFIKKNYESGIFKDICFHFEIAADILTEETMQIISSMPKGSVQFEAGIQSFNEKTLEKIHRKTNIEKLCKNIKRLVSFNNCHIHIDLIAALPYEDLASFKQSFNKAYALGAHMLQLGFLKILYGSCMERHKDEFVCSYSKTPPYEVFETPYISKEELLFLHGVEDVFEKLYNSMRFKRTLSYITSSSDMTAFDLFASFSLYCKEKGYCNLPLDKFTEVVFEYFSSLEGIDKAVLRDKLITDRIAVNSSDVIPKCLQIKDERLKTLKREIAQTDPLKKNTMRSVAILYTENCAVYCDYTQKDRVSGEYELKRYFN